MVLSSSSRRLAAFSVFIVLLSPHLICMWICPYNSSVLSVVCLGFVFSRSKFVVIFFFTSSFAKLVPTPLFCSLSLSLALTRSFSGCSVNRFGLAMAIVVCSQRSCVLVRVWSMDGWFQYAMPFNCISVWAGASAAAAACLPACLLPALFLRICAKKFIARTKQKQVK